MRNGAQTGSPEMMVVMRASASAEDVARLAGEIPGEQSIHSCLVPAALPG